MSVRPAREGNAAGERHPMENTPPVFSSWSAAAPTQHSHRCPLGRAGIRLRTSAQGSAWSFILPAQTCPQSWHTPDGGRDLWRSPLGDTILLCSLRVPRNGSGRSQLDTADHSGSQLAPSTPADPRRSHTSPRCCTMVGTLTSALCLAPSLAQRQVRKVLPGQLWPPEKERTSSWERLELKSQHRL